MVIVCLRGLPSFLFLVSAKVHSVGRGWNFILFFPWDGVCHFFSPFSSEDCWRLGFTFAFSPNGWPPLPQRYLYVFFPSCILVQFSVRQSSVLSFFGQFLPLPRLIFTLIACSPLCLASLLFGKRLLYMGHLLFRNGPSCFSFDRWGIFFPFPFLGHNNPPPALCIGFWGPSKLISWPSFLSPPFFPLQQTATSLLTCERHVPGPTSPSSIRSPPFPMSDMFVPFSILISNSYSTL